MYFFQRKKKGRVFSNSKPIQVNKTEVYLIGGSQTLQSLLARNYEVDISCLRIDLNSGELVQK